MKDMIVSIMKSGLHGKHTHVDPMKATRGLDAKGARLSPDGTHSSWAILYHIVKWQDATVEALRGTEVNWKEVSATDWPTEDEMIYLSPRYLLIVFAFDGDSTITNVSAPLFAFFANFPPSRVIYLYLKLLSNFKYKHSN